MKEQVNLLITEFVFLDNLEVLREI